VSKVNVERDSEGVVLPWCGPSMSLMRDSSGCGSEREEEGRKKDAQSSSWNRSHVATQSRKGRPLELVQIMFILLSVCQSHVHRNY
jgi:hypothetical protein